MNESILHCDLNGFYASVECLFRPELKNVPMAVSGNPANRHGIILAKNEAAKKFGVSTAETIWQAKRKCPNLVLVQPSHGRYAEYSRKVNSIYARFTNRIEPFGIDESWLDVSASQNLFGSPLSIADKIRKTVREELGLTLSVGVSFNKIFAKFGSDYKKPDATTLISRENYKDIIFPQPVGALLYVGKRTAESLRRMGILTIGELAEAPQKLLISQFGKHGELLHESANGRGDADVAFYGEQSQAKSIGNSVTYHRDIKGYDDFKAAIEDLAETVSARLVKENFKCSSISVTIKNPKLETIARQTSLYAPTNLAADLFDSALNVIRAEWDFSDPARMLGVTAMGLIDASTHACQLSIFAEENLEKQKRQNMQNAVEKVREKFGRESVLRANIAFSDLFKKSPNQEKNE